MSEVSFIFRERRRVGAICASTQRTSSSASSSAKGRWSSARQGWLGWIASLDAKTTLPRLAWEDARPTANVLRERCL